MSVLSASVEANGWVLSVRGAWGLSGFGSFALEPDGAARVQLQVNAAGFDRIGGQAVANGARARGAIVATKPLRRSVPGDLTSLDEVDHGDGTRTVRLALSRAVHAGEAVAACAFAAGWRAGLPAQAVAVANGSALAVELVSMRWASPQLILERGPFRVDLLVASAHAEGRDAVAAVRFRATDGSTTLSWWVAAASTSTVGDGVRCWGAVIDPAGLNAGLITVQADVFPWVGAMRSTGAGHAASAVAGFTGSAEAPLMVAWDPPGTGGATRWPAAHVFVDPVNGSASPSAAMVHGSLAAARAGLKAANVSVAVQAIYAANRSAPAANGLPPQTRMGDGAVVTLAAGTHGWGSTAVTFGFTVDQARMVVQGDPALADPRGSVFIDTAAGPPQLRMTRVHLRDVTLRIGDGALPGSGNWWHLERVTVQGKPGLEGSTLAPFSGGHNEPRLSMVRCRWWRSGMGPGGGNSRFLLLRSVEFSRTAAAPAIVGCVRLPDPTTGGSTAAGLSGLGLGVASQADCIWQGNDLRWSLGRAFQFPTWAASGGAGTAADPAVALRTRLVNNLFERAGSDPQPHESIGEDTWSMARWCLVEGNSFVGQRFNFGYNDPESGTQQLQCWGNAVRNNFFDWLPSKHDQFVDTPHGARPGFTGCWSVLYGVDYANNVLGERHPSSPAFAYEYGGLGTVANPAKGQAGNGWTRFVDDRCNPQLSGTAGVGGGDYRPAAGAPMIARASQACLDVDGAGAARGALFAAGALEPAAAMAVTLVAAGGRMAARGSVAAAGWAAAVRPQGARLGAQGTGSAAAWFGAVAGAAARICASGGGALGWAAALGAAAARLAARGGAAALEALRLERAAEGRTFRAGGRAGALRLTGRDIFKAGE